MAMDLIACPTSLSLVEPTTLLTRNRTPDSDPDTPPLPIQLYPKWVHQNHLHAPVELAVVVTYKECLKNHAASIGGHALDGCCEFMPGPTCNPSDPTSLKCAACGCHRNFHRRDPDDPTPLHHHPPAARGHHSPSSAPRLLLSLSGHAHEEANFAPMMGNGVGRQNGNFTTTSSGTSRKRFRTKFSQEQKEKMYEFSEKIGWKLKRGEEKLVEEFCKQIGVGRSVFKVWMHNNKHSSSIRKDKLLLDVGPNNININDININYTDNNINNNTNTNNNNNSSNGVVHHDFYSNGMVVQEQDEE